MSNRVFCQRLNKEAEALDFAPYPGELGQRVVEHISKEGWQEWINHQTMLINEYRLNLTDKKSREFLEAEMVKFLFEGGGDKPEGFTPPES